MYAYLSIWDGMWESNPRILEPQSSVLTTSPMPPLLDLIKISYMQKKIK